MTNTRFVADDEIGKIAIKQCEVIRRVKEGTLTSKFVLDKLQQIIEGIDPNFNLTLKLSKKRIATDAIPIIELEGRFSTGHGSGKFMDYVEEKLALGLKTFIFDFEKVDYIDRSGLGDILIEAEQIKRVGGKLILMGLGPDKFTTVTGSKIDSLPLYESPVRLVYDMYELERIYS
jgi:anti-anti-sigma factor